MLALRVRGLRNPRGSIVTASEKTPVDVCYGGAQFRVGGCKGVPAACMVAGATDEVPQAPKAASLVRITECYDVFVSRKRGSTYLLVVAYSHSHVQIHDHLLM